MRAGAEVGTHDYRGRTPLHYAVGFANGDVLAALLKSDVNPNPQDDRGSKDHPATHLSRPLSRYVLTYGPPGCLPWRLPTAWMRRWAIRLTGARSRSGSLRDRARTTGTALESHSQFLLWLVPTVGSLPAAVELLLRARIEVAALDVLDRLIEATCTRRRSGHRRARTWGSRKLRSPTGLDRLAEWRDRIGAHLNGRRVRLHPRKTPIVRTAEPAPFPGFVLLPDRRRATCGAFGNACAACLAAGARARSRRPKCSSASARWSRMHDTRIPAAMPDDLRAG